MHIKFIAHDAKNNANCNGLVEYLNKENEQASQNVKLQENFFNHDYNEKQPFQDISLDQIKHDINSNRGSRKETESNFYMINISPSKDELSHIENLAENELFSRGINAENLVFDEAKEELIKLQLKLYTKSVLNEYALNFEREIFCNPEMTPSIAEKKQLEIETDIVYQEYLKEKGLALRHNTDPARWHELKKVQILSENEKALKIEMNIEGFGNQQTFIPKYLLYEQKDGSFKIPQTSYDKKINEAIEKEHGSTKQEIYEQLAHKKGFDLSKRQLTGDDLLWYGKVESQRHYSYTDLPVKQNKIILEEIRNNRDNPNEIKKLENCLIRDKASNEIIKSGMQKGGSNYHVHVMVSRHDKTNGIARNKISLSPMSAAKDKMLLAGKNQVGFNRVDFFKSAEQIFDEKFEFSRPKQKTFEHYNNLYKNRNNSKTKLKTNAIAFHAKSKVKSFIINQTGLNEIKKHISPLQTIKNELPFAKIPTSFPKSLIDLSIKILKKSLDAGLEL